MNPDGLLDRIDAWLDARLAAVKAGLDGWFTRPEPDAAGRAGLDRILYALFYLWYLSDRDPATVARLLALGDYSIFNVRLSRAVVLSPSPDFLRTLDSLLVAALVLLLLGLWVRATAAAVLVLGTTIEAYSVAVDGEHATVFLAFYTPLFMLILGRAGRTYSIDAMLRRRAGGAVVEPSDSSWTFALPARAQLVLLAALFFTSGYFKVSPGGTWRDNPSVLANLVLVRNIRADLAELPTNPLAPYIAATPWAHRLLRDGVLAFEFGFILALIPALRPSILATGLIFHGINALLFGVSFTPVLVAYLPFINWEAAVRRIGLARRPRRPPASIPPWVPILGAVGLALAAGMMWNRHPHVRAMFNLAGLLGDRTIWLAITPLAFAWWVASVHRLVRSAVRGTRGNQRGRADSMSDSTSLDAFGPRSLD